MTLRAAIVLAFGLATAGEAAAQYFPPSPPPPYYPPPYRGGPVIDDDQQPTYEDPRPYARRVPSPYPPYDPQPPADPRYERQVTPLPADPRYERPVPPASLRPPFADPYERTPLPAPSARRDEDPTVLPPPGFGRPPGEVPGAPPLQVAPGRPVEAPTGSTRVAGLPPEYSPEEGKPKELPLQFRRQLVNYPTKEPAGTIIIDTQNTFLYVVLGKGEAVRYGIGVGREGFTWSGTERISKMAEWPDWHPPAEMIERQPYLPRFMAGGDGNPLGARALYLGKTLYRIHGTNQPSTIGQFVSSGCIRMLNRDVEDLYQRVNVGTRVVVLPGKAPATASAAPPPAPSALPPPPPPPPR
jgi:lipoprotein-anchoring transpeptidase ErfK/SrfK